MVCSDSLSNRFLVISSVLLAALLSMPILAAERDLRDRWTGAWVVTRLEAFSACGGNYTNNEVRGRLVSDGGSFRFEPGELASVYKVDLKRKRVDVLIDLAEPVLVSRQDGPFTLYDERTCKVELRIHFPAGLVPRDTESVDALILSVLERHETLSSAEGSERWNLRKRDPYPADYERTLAEYEVWKASQINAAVQERIEESLERAARIVDRLDEDPDFLAGFAAGVDDGRRETFTRDCERLLTVSEHAFVDSPPSGENREWKDGFREGQRLVFFLELGRRLPSCFLPPPFPASFPGGPG
jgi:hypothetical protein